MRPRRRGSVAASRGVFIVLEGPDKSGKSTQADLLARRLRREGFPVLHTREPGGTSFAEAVRHVLLDPRRRVEPLAELLLYEAARAQHAAQALRPALAAGKIVVCERFTLATLVYQGHARGLPLEMVRELNRLAAGDLSPDLTVVLDVPDSEFRRRDRSRRLDRLERESAGFRRRVREGYLRLAARAPGTRVVDSRGDPRDVHRKVWGLVAGGPLRARLAHPPSRRRRRATGPRAGSPPLSAPRNGARPRVPS